MKRQRRPPKTWRRNMLAGLALMVVLDAIIISPGPDLARGVLALVVTVVVGGFVLATWVSNSRMEKAAQKGSNGEGKSSPGDASGK